MHPANIGPYRVLNLIAESGCSKVFAAQDADKRKVAIKLSKTQDNRKNHFHNSNSNVFADLLKRESEALEHLRHPGIVHLLPIHLNEKPIYIARDPRLDDSPWYTVMEFIPGKSLRQLLKQVAGYSLEWRLELFYQLLLLVDFIHREELAHCDLKLENIMFRIDPTQYAVPVPVLIDFGTCSRVNKLTSEPSATVPYCAPEMLSLIYAQEAKQPVYPENIQPMKLDVYALGVIFIELVTGEEYMGRLSDKQKRTSVIDHTNPGVREVNPKLPEKLDHYFWHMAAPDPDERKDVRELIIAMDKYLSPPPRIAPKGDTRGLFSR
jgi:serine/threonine-protein kinase